MFGIGPQEMAIVALFALIVFGPGTLPEVMREAGKHYRKFKGMADEMTGELNKVTAEARKELDGAFGELGPDMQKSLGLGSKATTSSRASTSSSTAKKSTSSSSTAKRTTSTTSSTAKKSTASGTTAAKSTGTSSTAASATKTSTKPVVATREDPLADFVMFDVEARPTTRRVRTATPAAITDLTPRLNGTGLEPEVAVQPPETTPPPDDAVNRARARRRTAGYARA